MALKRASVPKDATGGRQTRGPSAPIVPVGHQRTVDLQKTDRPLPDRPTDNFCALFLLERGAYSLLTTDPHQQRRPGPRGTSRLVGDRSAPGQTPVGPKSLAGVLGDGRSRCRLPARWSSARRSVSRPSLLWRAHRHKLCYNEGAPHAHTHTHTQERAPAPVHSLLNATPCAHARVDAHTHTDTRRHTRTRERARTAPRTQTCAHTHTRARRDHTHICKALFLT